MPYAVRRDLFGKCNRHNLLGRRNKTPRLIDDVENSFNALFHNSQPPLIDDLVENAVFLLQRIIARLYHLKEILEIPVVLQGLYQTRILRI